MRELKYMIEHQIKNAKQDLEFEKERGQKKAVHFLMGKIKGLEIALKEIEKAK